MTWDPITSPIDHVLVAGQRSPGVTEVQGAGSPREWEKRKSRGMSGASIVFTGLDLAEFSITTKVVTAADFRAYQDWAAFARRPPTGATSASFAIWHPLLELCGIAAAVVKNQHAPEQTADGEWSFKIDMLEYREPRRALTRTRGTTETPDDVAIREARARRDVAATARDQARRTGR